MLGIDFKKEVGLGNACFSTNDWKGAAAHYLNTLNEIERQQTLKKAALPPQAQALVERVAFNIVECQLELGSFDEAQVTLNKYPFMRASKNLVRSSFLQAKLYFSQKNFRGAIEVLKSLNYSKYEFDRYYLDSLFLLTSCYISEKQFKVAELSLSKAKEYLQSFPIAPEANYFLFQIHFYLGLVSKANDNPLVTQQHFEKAKSLFDANCKTDKSNLDIPFVCVGIILLCEIVNSKNLFTEEKIANVLDEIVQLLPIIYSQLSVETKHIVALALLNGIQFNLQKQENAKAHSLLNLLLSLEVKASSELSKAFIAAATFYFNPEFLNVSLASRFVSLAKRYATQADVTMDTQISILEMIENLHLNNVELAKKIFNKLEVLVKNEPSDIQANIRQLYRKQLPLFPNDFKSDDLEFYLQLCSFSLESLSLGETTEEFSLPFTPQNAAQRAPNSISSANPSLHLTPDLKTRNLAV